MDKDTYDLLSNIVFSSGYPGYKPEVKELPNGDGKVDADKRYAHVAEKYLDGWRDGQPERLLLESALCQAYTLALRVTEALGVSLDYMPRPEYGALRILEYPVGATSHLHTDPNLFTLMIYRDQPECFVSHDFTGPELVTPHDYIEAAGQYSRLNAARQLNAQLHIGEMGELLGLGPATPHEVIASDRPQHSIVYFAIPDWKAVLPTGQTVEAFLQERLYTRGRTY